MENTVCTSRCEGCWFFAKSTRACECIFHMDRRRPCPAGNECTVRMTEKQWRSEVSKPKWNTELGYQMYLEGKSDAEIAQAVGISEGSVWYRRKNHWETMPHVNAAAAPAEDNDGKRPGADFGSFKPISTFGPTAPKGGKGSKKKTGKQTAPVADVKEQPGAKTDALPTADPAAGNDRSGVMALIEGAVEKKCGIDAVLTADAILCLWQWETPQHLQAAKQSIERLLERVAR